jgi:DNA-binding NtrC family response regulator
MTPDNTQRSVLLIGKSQRVLDESAAGLRELGYQIEATNDFADVTGPFDARTLDLVVFGGQVPLDRKVELREEIGTINPRVIFVQGLAGIPGLIVKQVQGAFAASTRHRPTHPTNGRSG